MKEQVKVSLVQLDCEWLDRETNAKRMVEFIEQEATQHGADLIVFPELATTGYIEPHTDAEFARRLYEQSEVVPGPTTELIAAAAARHHTHVMFGVSRRHEEIPGVLYNSSVFVGPDGEIIGIHDKVHPCLSEKNYYVAGNTIDIYDTALGKIAMQVCYDVRFPEMSRVHALKGAEIIVSMWASFVQPGKVPSSSIIDRCSTRSMENALFFLGCNRSGQEGDRVYYGRSAISAPSGDAIAVSDNQDEEVVRGTLLSQALVDQRAYLTVFRDRRPELYGMLTEQL